MSASGGTVTEAVRIEMKYAYVITVDPFRPPANLKS